jgi:hypothetical protein
MDLYTEIAKWTGWPAIVALMLIAGGLIYWFLNNRLEYQKEINAQLSKGWLEYKSAVSQRASYLDVDYGIRITSPKNGENVGEWVDVSGVYSIMPPPDTLRLFTVNPEKTNYGERFWPQEIVKDFSPETKTWRARVHSANDPSDIKWGIIAAVVGKSTIVLWDYYYKVGPRIGWWDFEGWPQDDTKTCDRITVRRV